MPQVLTAVVRSVPARTKAKATIRRAAAPSFSRPAAARSCAEVISVRVIATAVIDVPLKASSTSSQNFTDSGIPESNLPAVGINYLGRKKHMEKYIHQKAPIDITTAKSVKVL